MEISFYLVKVEMNFNEFVKKASYTFILFGISVVEFNSIDKHFFHSILLLMCKNSRDRMSNKNRIIKKPEQR
jgi:hypothetical protein